MTKKEKRIYDVPSFIRKFHCNLLDFMKGKVGTVINN